MTVTVDPRNLTRSQQRDLQRTESFGDLAEAIVREVWNLSNESGEWYDATHPNSNARYEIKSTSSEIGDKYPGDGRFRVWESQTNSLIASDRANVAWYVFVFMDESDGLLRLQRRKPSTVLNIVNKRGGWNESGHPMGRQYKLPYSDVMNV